MELFSMVFRIKNKNSNNYYTHITFTFKNGAVLPMFRAVLRHMLAMHLHELPILINNQSIVLQCPLLRFDIKQTVC